MLSLQDGARFYPRYPGTIKVSWMKSLTPDSFSLMNINSLSRLKKRGGEGGRERGKERGREKKSAHLCHQGSVRTVYLCALPTQRGGVFSVRAKERQDVLPHGKDLYLSSERGSFLFAWNSPSAWNSALSLQPQFPQTLHLPETPPPPCNSTRVTLSLALSPSQLPITTT